MVEPSGVLAEISFMKSRAILTAAELDVFTVLGRHPTAKGLAGKIGLDARATTRLLDCLVGLGFLEKHHSEYRLTEKGALLSSEHPETVLPMVLHTNHLWARWSCLTEVVRRGSAAVQSGREREPAHEHRKTFVDAMHTVAKGLSAEIADGYDLSRFRRLLDIGGASGTYTAAFLAKNPSMTAVLFDLEAVIPIAHERLQAQGLLERVELVEGDFYKDELPKGCDLAFLSAIIHQNSPEQNVELYRKVFRALLPGGVILIRDHIMDETRTRPVAGALFALNMLVNTPGGDTYTFQEVKEGLEAAGFENVGLLRWGERMDSLVEARKPA